ADLDIGTVDDVVEGDTTVTGSGALPGSTIVVKDADGNELVRGTVKPDGSFEVELNRAAKAGEELTVQQWKGNESGDPVTIEVQSASNDGSGEEVEIISNGNNGGSGSSGTTDGNGQILPNTASDTFNWLLGGLVALFAGLGGILSTKRRRDSENR